MENMFRDLKANEIDVRIAQVKQNGVSLLLYKDARVDQNILDETVGPYNWQREHEFKDSKLYCKVSIWDKEKGQWIYKEDVGTESFSEAEKGQASDSFKRACFNWGIGRELYTAPFIWIKAEDTSIKESTTKGKFNCFDKFTVEAIQITNKEITGLAIKNNQGKRVFVYKK